MKKTILLSAVALSLVLVAPESRASTACGAVVNNLVANCGFETGTFSSWTLSGNDTPGELNNLYGVESGTDPVTNVGPNNGNFQAYFGDLVENATTISQSILTTASDTYTISFYLAQQELPGNPTNIDDLIVSFGGTNLATLTIPNEAYTKYSYTAVASGPSSVLSLTLGDEYGGYTLDDVSVTQNAAPTPEPSSLLLLATGLAGVAGAARRRFSR